MNTGKRQAEFGRSFAARLLVTAILLSTAVIAVPLASGRTAVAAPAPPQITTIAGGPGQGPATSLSQSVGAVLPLDGSLYVADPVANVIRAIDPSGAETVIAGTGARGYAGDGGLARAALLNLGPSVAMVGDGGTILFIDEGNHAVRQIDDLKPGPPIIHAAVGDGSACPDAVTTACGDGGPAGQAELNDPVGLAAIGNFSSLIGWTDLGQGSLASSSCQCDLFIADAAEHRIRAVVSGGTIVTVAGNGHSTSECSTLPRLCADGLPARESNLDPLDVAADPGGDIFIIDANRSCAWGASGAGGVIQEVEVNTGLITTYAGGDPLSRDEPRPTCGALPVQLPASPYSTTGIVPLNSSGVPAAVAAMAPARVAFATHSGALVVSGQSFQGTPTTADLRNLQVGHTGMNLVATIDSGTRMATIVAGGGTCQPEPSGYCGEGGPHCRPSSLKRGVSLRMTRATCILLTGNGLAWFAGIRWHARRPARPVVACPLGTSPRSRAETETHTYRPPRLAVLLPHSWAL